MSEMKAAVAGLGSLVRSGQGQLGFLCQGKEGRGWLSVSEQGQPTCQHQGMGSLVVSIRARTGWLLMRGQGHTGGQLTAPCNAWVGGKRVVQAAQVTPSCFCLLQRELLLLTAHQAG